MINIIKLFTAVRKSLTRHDNIKLVNLIIYKNLLEAIFMITMYVVKWLQNDLVYVNTIVESILNLNYSAIR